MLRSEVINQIVKNKGYNTYLEIGVKNYYHNCDKILCETKHTVDPYPESQCDYVMTSDEFFANLKPETKYDIIFIDGLHVSEQVDRDIENSLKHLNVGGTIVLHDCLPLEEIHQYPYPVVSAWYGDVWKSVMKIKMTRNDLNIRIVDTDAGCGILTTESQSIYTPQDEEDVFTWDWYQSNYRSTINILSTEKFIELYPC